MLCINKVGRNIWREAPTFPYIRTYIVSGTMSVEQGIIYGLVVKTSGFIDCFLPQIAGITLLFSAQKSWIAKSQVTKTSTVTSRHDSVYSTVN